MPPHLAGYGHIASNAHRPVERKQRQPPHNLPRPDSTEGAKGTVPCRIVAAGPSLTPVTSVIDSIYEVIGLVKPKNLHTSPFRSGKTVKGARRAFIWTLDSLPRFFTIERRNEAKRSSVKLRSIGEGFCFSGFVSSLRWKPNGNPETYLFALFLNSGIAASTKRLARNL